MPTGLNRPVHKGLGDVVKAAFPHHAFSRKALVSLLDRERIDREDVRSLLPLDVPFDIKQTLRDVVEQLSTTYQNGQYLGLNCVQAYYSVQLLSLTQFNIPSSESKMEVVGHHILRETAFCLTKMEQALALPSSPSEQTFNPIPELDKLWKPRVFDPNAQWSNALNRFNVERNWLSCESLKSLLLVMASLDIQLVPLYKHALKLNHELNLDALFKARMEIMGLMEEVLFAEMPSRKTMVRLQKFVQNELMSIAHVNECLRTVIAYYKKH
jgi:hypothetical protein